MADVDYIQATDLEDYIKDLNLSQFQESNILNRFLEIFSDLNLRRQQEIVDIAQGKILINAVGEQLDEIGRQFQLPRYNSSDGPYRTRLLLASKKRTADIVRDGIVDIVAIASGDANPSIYQHGNHQVDVAVLAACIGGEEGARQIGAYFPLNTNLKVIGTIGGYLGFGKRFKNPYDSEGDGPDYDDENGRYIKDDPKALGFGTTEERNSAVNAGRFSSFVFSNRSR